VTALVAALRLHATEGIISSLSPAGQISEGLRQPRLGGRAHGSDPRRSDPRSDGRSGRPAVPGAEGEPCALSRGISGNPCCQATYGPHRLAKWQRQLLGDLSLVPADVEPRLEDCGAVS
jgi:hypothetical protein